MKLLPKILALAAILLPAAPASAVVYTVDWTGTLDDGYDLTGIFGPTGTDLTGQTAHLAFRVDTQTPGATKGPDQFGAFIRGRDAAVPVTAFVTINGVTFQMNTHPVYVPTDPFNVFVRDITNPNSGSAIEWNQSPGLDEIDQSVFQIDDIQVFDEMGSRFVNILDNRAEAYVLSSHFDIADLNIETAPTPHVFTMDDNAFAFFNISSFFEESVVTGGNNPVTHVYYNEFAYGRFIPTSYSVTINDAGSAAPEPAAWALMILGFGAVGTALRRRGSLRAAAV